MRRNSQSIHIGVPKKAQFVVVVSDYQDKVYSKVTTSYDG